MKKSELRNVIKEEVKNVLNEIETVEEPEVIELSKFLDKLGVSYNPKRIYSSSKIVFGGIKDMLDIKVLKALIRHPKFLFINPSENMGTLLIGFKK